MAIYRDRTDGGLPLFVSPEVARECDRWIRLTGADPYAGPESVGLHDVLRAHFLIVDFFEDGEATEPIGVVGPQNLNLLHSALSRQFVGFGPQEKWSDRFDRLATVFFGLVKNHPFHDSNKRTALLTVLHQLNRLGRCSQIPKRDWEDLAVRIAADELGRYPGYRDYLRGDDSEVRFLSKFLQSKTRKIERRHYVVTYRQLELILRRYEFRIANPNGNFIDVVREVVERKRLFGARQAVLKKICQVGFPGWNTEVSRSAIKTIRRECRLTDAEGIDSQSFFKGVEPMHALIAEYSDALRRLADR